MKANWTIMQLLRKLCPTGQRYLTLAQTFKLLATALREHAERGAFPTIMQTDLTYGPIGTWSEIVQGVEQEIEARAVIAEAARLNFGTERKRGSTEPPANRVPLNVTVDGQAMHAAQFPRLMGEHFQTLRKGQKTGTLRVRPSNILPPLAVPWQRAHPFYADTPAVYGYLQLWTVKPAQFNEAMSAAASVGK